MSCEQYQGCLLHFECILSLSTAISPQTHLISSEHLSSWPQPNSSLLCLYLPWSSVHSCSASSLLEDFSCLPVLLSHYLSSSWCVPLDDPVTKSGVLGTHTVPSFLAPCFLLSACFPFPMASGSILLFGPELSGLYIFKSKMMLQILPSITFHFPKFYRECWPLYSEWPG